MKDAILDETIWEVYSNGFINFYVLKHQQGASKPMNL